MLVQDIMSQSFPQLHKDELVTKSRALLRSQGLRVCPVVDDNNRLVGMVSRGDVMTVASSVSPIQVRGIMSHPGFIATIGMDAFYAGREMVRLHEWYIPVTQSS
ncbi:CBS domain-containing protein [Candidatus Bathyarchaeota archaeon]|nr:CBS domain-containing protein [Candidatus Bathyarchaeota archaeon]